MAIRKGKEHNDCTKSLNDVVPTVANTTKHCCCGLTIGTGNSVDIVWRITPPEGRGELIQPTRLLGYHVPLIF